MQTKTTRKKIFTCLLLSVILVIAGTVFSAVWWEDYQPHEAYTCSPLTLEDGLQSQLEASAQTNTMKMNASMSSMIYEPKLPNVTDSASGASYGAWRPAFTVLSTVCCGPVCCAICFRCLICALLPHCLFVLYCLTGCPHWLPSLTALRLHGHHNHWR